MTWPKTWLTAFFVALPFFLTDSGKGLSVSEVAIGGFFMLTITIWTLWQIADPREQLVRWWGDFLLLLFLLLSLGNAFIAMANGVRLIDWVSEWSIYLLVLYYFPIRKYFTADERSVRQVLILGAISTVLMALYSVVIYKQRMDEGGAAFAYQLLSARSVLMGPFFVMAILIGIPAAFWVKRAWRPFVALVVLINAGALALTFTRSLWLILAVSMLGFILYLKPWQNIKLVIAMSVVAISTYLAADAYNAKLTAVVLRMVENRIKSSSQLSGGDYSFETRLIEADAASNAIAKYPLGGSGIRATFVSWGPIEQFTWRKSFVHIGFIGLPYKLGIPLALIMFWTILLFTWRSITSGLWVLFHRNLEPNSKALLVGTLLSYPTLYVVIFFAGFFDQRWGMVMLAFILAATSITHEIVERRRLNGQQQLL